MRKIMLFLASLVFLLAGCSNIVQQENDTDSSSGGAAGAFLRVTAETEGFAARKEEASARTALPTIDESAVEDSFTCTLKGTKEGGSEETLVSGVSFEELEGKQIPVTTGRWSFTLTAEKDGTVFKGTCDNKDIGAGDNSLDFLLEWDESALSGTGSLAFSLDWSKAGLGSVEAATGTLFAYDPDTGTETATAYTESSGGISLDMAASTVTYRLSDVPAGVYMIRIAFYSDEEKTSLAGTWRELAVITGGQESGADRVMSVFVKHSATIDPMTAGNLSGITEKTISVEGIATLAENIDGTYTLTSESMGTSVLTFSGTNADGESVAVTYDVSVSDTGEIKVGAPVVKNIFTVAVTASENGTVTADKASAEAGAVVTLTATPKDGYVASVTIKNAADEDISSSVSLSQNSEDTTKWTFTMPEGNVYVTVSFAEPVNTVTLKTGGAINSILVSLCPAEYGEGSACTKFARSETNKDEATLYLDTEGKYIPVWSEDTVVYYYVPDGCTPVMNEDSSRMFYGCFELTSLDVSKFVTSKVENMSGMFANCYGLTSLDVTGFDTSKVTNMEGMFYCCSGLKSLDVTGFDTSNVTNMEGMFKYCSKITGLDVSKFVTSKVENMSGMFSGCYELTSLEVTGFDTSNVTNMSSMFFCCYKLTSLDVSKFVTSKVTDMSSMFSGCKGLTSLDVSKFVTSKVTDMSGMFYDCYGLKSLDLSNFDTSKVSNMWGMFYACSELTTIYASDKFVTTSIPDDDIGCKGKCFYFCKKLVGGAGTTFDANDEDKTLAVPYARIDGGTDAPGYFTKNPFVLVKGTTITGSETWTPESEVFMRGRSLTIGDLYVCDHEVTRGEFNALMGEDPSTADAYDKDGNELTGDYALNNPVNNVNWYAAIAYCNKLSIKEGLAPAYTVSGITDWENLAYSSIPTSSNKTWNAATCNFEANGYRLPTEAEWEWLARGGENYTYAGSATVDDVAWYTDNTSGSRDVKTKAANGYGLYDMSGNVYEWCWDWYDGDISSCSATGAASGSVRVSRGGSWTFAADCCAVSCRDCFNPFSRGYNYGFRVVRNAD